MNHAIASQKKCGLQGPDFVFFRKYTLNAKHYNIMPQDI